jgi:hypothetical protein
MAAYYEPARYRARITRQSLGENKKGNPELQIHFKPYGIYGPDGQLQPFDFPYERTVYLVFTDATLGTPDQPGWVIATLAHLGFTGDSFALLDPGEPNHVSFVNQEVDVFCEVETYEGKEREKWNIQRQTTVSTQKPLEKKGIRALDAKFGRVLKTMSPTRPIQPSMPAPAMASVMPEEEIPF